jgi:hypothetical protein
MAYICNLSYLEGGDQNWHFKARPGQKKKNKKKNKKKLGNPLQEIKK